MSESFLSPIIRSIILHPESSILLFMTVSLIVGIVTYRIVEAMLSGVSGFKAGDEGKWGRLVDVGICTVCVPYLVIFLISYLSMGSHGGKFADEIFGIPRVDRFSCAYTMLAFGSISGLGVLLLSIGFAVKCALNIRAFPWWLKILSVAAMIHICMKFYDIWRGVDMSRWSKELKHETYVNMPAFCIISIITLAALSYMLYCAFKPMYRGRKRAA
jgi:hypothetical protein